MTHQVESRPLTPATNPAPAAAAPTLMDRVDRGLEWLWHFLSSMRLAMVIMLAIAALAIPGTIFRQMPAEIALANPQNPSELAQWVDGVRPFYGTWTDIWNTLGFYNVFNGLPFRILVMVLTVSLIACSIHRIPGMIRTATKPRVDVGPAFFDHAPQHEAIVSRQSAEETTAVVTAVLRGRRYRVVTADNGTVSIYGDRWRWLTFSGLIAHLAIVLILAGAIIGGAFGFRDPEFAISEGASRAVTADPGLAIRLDDFTDKYDTTTGMPIDYVSSVTVLRNGQPESTWQIRVNDPLRVDGITFYQAGFGSSAVMDIKDAQGNTLVNEGIPFTWQLNAEERPLGIYQLEAQNQVIWVMGTTGDSGDRIAPGQVEVQVFDSGASAPADSKVIDMGKPATIAGMSMTFVRETQHTRLNVAKDPGVPFVWIGSLLITVGFSIRFMFPHKRLWGRITARGNGAVVGLATLTSRDVAAGSEFDDIANDIRAALTASAKA